MAEIQRVKLIIAGSRVMPFSDFPLIQAAIDATAHRFEPVEVVSGYAPGADTWGEKWAWQVGLPFRRFPARWREEGKRAGLIRNARMAEYADALVVFIYGDSPGSRDMRQKMRALKKPVFDVEDGTVEMDMLREKACGQT